MRTFALLAALAFLHASASAQEVQKSVDVNVMRPKVVDATPARIAGLRAAEGWKVATFATGLGNARMLEVGPDGTVYLTRRSEGDLMMIRDSDGDGTADSQRSVLELKNLHGIFRHEKSLYLATVNEVYISEIGPDGVPGKPRLIIDDLPDGGQHPNRTLAVGPDGKLYISVGSTCNSCLEPNEEAATMLRCELDGSKRTIFAKGLRNTIGFGWHPESGQMWGMDHGIDDMGDDKPGEELNLLEEGKDYGWPFVSNSEFNDVVYLPKGMSKEALLAKNTSPALLYAAHASPLGMVFAKKGAQADADLANDAFVTFRGSWNRKSPSGYVVTRVRFEGSSPAKFEPFVSGFLSADAKECFGRPCGVAWANDGSLLFTDDANGVIYRVSKAGR